VPWESVIEKFIYLNVRPLTSWRSAVSKELFAVQIKPKSWSTWTFLRQSVLPLESRVEYPEARSLRIYSSVILAREIVPEVHVAK
jgi:hypothetical protein